MRYKKTIGIVVLVVLLVFAWKYIASNIEDFKELKIVNPWLIVWMIGLLIVGLFVTGKMNAQPLRAMNVELGTWEEFKLAVVTRFYNLITPFRGGMIARATYLKKRHGFAYTNFLATLAASYVLIFLVAGIVGLFASYMIYQSSGSMSGIIVGIFSITVVSMLSVIIFSPRFPETRFGFLNYFIRVLNGWNLIKNNRKVILNTIGFSILQILISGAMIYLQFRVFGVDLNYWSALFISALGAIGFLIAVTPAGLGIQEAIVVFSATAIGIGVSESLAAALLGRAVSLGVLLILGPIFSWVLIKKKAKLL